MRPSLARSKTSGGLAYHRSGPTAPEGQIVLLHGVGLRLESWLPQIEALGQRFDVLALDLPGHGSSARLADPEPRLSAYAEALVTGMDELCQGPVYLVGHSLGALIALEIAARWPQRLLGLTALSAIYQRSEEARQAVMARAEALQAAAAQGQVADPEPTLQRWFGAAQTPELARWAEACRTWLTQTDGLGDGLGGGLGDGLGYAQAYQTFAQQYGPAPQQVAQLAMPCLFATGADDPNSTPAMSQALAAAAPQGAALVLEGAAHMAQLTHADALGQALAQHLETIITSKQDADLGAGPRS